ncbi:MAG: long-chain fatty acid--CoA ligase [Betaproteobacteria bacterium]|nr:MAG: long-chain fatty acid--CoA ligase [Betaproteobacteria bacterium]
MPKQLDVIAPEAARTLDGLFAARAQRSRDTVAYINFDDTSHTWKEYTWGDMEQLVSRWQAALAREALEPGDRVAIMMRNSIWWIIFDQAAMGLGLVTVPLYTSDRPDNIAYIVQDSGAKVLFFEDQATWNGFSDVMPKLGGLVRAVCLKPLSEAEHDARLVSADNWVAENGDEVKHINSDGGKLASIVYTSGTTGRPKGVMLSHSNMLENAYAAAQCFPVYTDDLFLSFLPMSHTLERTCGYYGTVMSGAQVAFARSVLHLAEDLLRIRPTVLISVPRIYERVYAAIKQKLHDGPAYRRKLFEFATDVGWARFEHQQKRGPWRLRFLFWPILQRLVAAKVMARLGGRLRAAICGGAALPPDVAKLFIGLGLPVVQGYGLTETSPVVSTNRIDDNVPASIGKPIPNVKVKIGEKDALLVKGPNVMLGYWNNPDATREVFTDDGWLDTGDTVRMDGDGRLYITGRLKEIIVLSNGEKVPPVDMETAIQRDPLFEQVMVMGEHKPYLAVFVVLNPEQWAKVAAEHGLDAKSASALHSDQVEEIVLERVSAQIHEFPGYAQVRRAAVMPEPWTIENGLLTPTMKVKRAKVVQAYQADYQRVFPGH